MAQHMSTAQHVMTRIRLFTDWYKLVVPFNRIISRSQKLHMRNGISLEVGDIFSSDVAILLEVFGEDTYQLEQLELRTQPTIFDIGANIGAFSLAAKKTFPDAHIVAYEPSPRNYALLKQNDPFAQLHEAAITGTSGAVQIQAEGTHTGLALVAEGGIEVPGISLHDALADIDRVDLLKMDIEGAEYDVCKNVLPEDMQKIHAVIMEVHDINQFSWFEDFLTSHGFTVVWFAPHLLRAQRLSPAL